MKSAVAIAVFLCAATCVAADALVKPTPELLDKIFSGSNTANPAAVRGAMDAAEAARKTIVSIQTAAVNPLQSNHWTGGWSYRSGQLIYASAAEMKADLDRWTAIQKADQQRLSDLRQKTIVAYPALKPPFSVGQFGEFTGVPKLGQIWGDTDAVYSLSDTYNETSFWLRGLSTKGLTADDDVPISGPLVVTGTNLLNGKTIMVLEPLDDALIQSQYKQALSAKKAPGK